MTRDQELTERFFRYLAIPSQSDVTSSELPSTPGQLQLARLLATELQELGLQDVVVDDQAIVTALLRGKRPGCPRIGFIAHLDTADIGLSPEIRPAVHRFTGSDICLNREADTWLRVDEHPEIRRWQNQDIITGDGTSVLGADNKAAIAVIMTVLAHLTDPTCHGDIFVAFVPDEEIGLRGAKVLDLSRFPCDFAYTIDCCEVGEVVVENFNAASCEIIFHGVSAHPMSAKNKLVNPLLMAQNFIALFDPMDTPEHTEEREGFFWFTDLKADDSSARLQVLIRDFDDDNFERRKQKIAESAEIIRRKYSAGHVEYHLTDAYRNVGPRLKQDPRPMKLLLDALEKVNIEPRLISMRGGTDGAVLSERGIATPNMFTGAYNFHSRCEFLPVPAFVKSFETVLTICHLAARM
ncbi:peptidase T [Brucella intermedia]|uniref:peptidase T n=1 Tax=Brucella intermedia TaxID=94625 RepID=UPI00159131DC|nr:peptidase T [Brucella intermedia]